MDNHNASSPSGSSPVDGSHTEADLACAMTMVEFKAAAIVDSSSSSLAATNTRRGTDHDGTMESSQTDQLVPRMMDTSPGMDSGYASAERSVPVKDEKKSVEGSPVDVDDIPTECSAAFILANLISAGDDVPETSGSMSEDDRATIDGEESDTAMEDHLQPQVSSSGSDQARAHSTTPQAQPDHSSNLSYCVRVPSRRSGRISKPSLKAQEAHLNR